MSESQRYDGKWVLRSDTDLGAAEVALKYRELWRVEQLFRSIKSILETRSIYHKCDETIRGHVFCSFLAMVLQGHSGSACGPWAGPPPLRRAVTVNHRPASSLDQAPVVPRLLRL